MTTTSKSMVVFVTPPVKISDKKTNVYAQGSLSLHPHWPHRPAWSTGRGSSRLGNHELRSVEGSAAAKRFEETQRLHGHPELRRREAGLLSAPSCLGIQFRRIGSRAEVFRKSLQHGLVR